MTQEHAKLGQRGIAHLGLLLLAFVVIAVGAVAYRVMSAEEGGYQATVSSEESQEEKEAAALNGAADAAEDADAQAVANEKEAVENVEE